MLAPIFCEQPHRRPVQDANYHLQNAQQAGGTQRPAIAQQGVVLLLDADTRQASQNVQAIGQFLELHQIHLPLTILLLNDGFEGKRGVAMAAASIMKNDVNFLGPSRSSSE